MTDAERRAHARRDRMILRKARLGDAEVDLSPIFGAEAVSLVHHLTRMSYSLAGQPCSSLPRSQLPCRFVPLRHG